jgi:hypothetical protein
MIINKTSIIVTTINTPNKAIKALSNGAIKKNWDFIIIGDQKSPKDYNLAGVKYFSLKDQYLTKFKFAKLCPLNHYSRKNIGYLIAAKEGNEIIVETDDDNIPRKEFWNHRNLNLTINKFENTGWIKIYKYFSNDLIWPRGLPLTEVNNNIDLKISTLVEDTLCPIQQGLADKNPDVDAIYRLILPLPINFNKINPIALGVNSWCPFNSQNTTWWKIAFPLLYLPSYCSFRMTDIWRSFVAQRIAWEYNWSIMFHNATVYQDRNVHNLMRDFNDEISGYIYNDKIKNLLLNLQLDSNIKNINDNIIKCYKLLIKNNFLNKNELILLESWLDDLKK